MVRWPIYVLALLLAAMLGASVHWAALRLSSPSPNAISLVECSATTDTEFLNLDYSFDIRIPDVDRPFVMVHASVFDDISATSRYMGHSGYLHDGGIRSGEIRERLYIFKRLADPYIVVVVTASDASGSIYERTAFTVPVQSRDRRDSAEDITAAEM